MPFLASPALFSQLVMYRGTAGVHLDLGVGASVCPRSKEPGQLRHPPAPASPRLRPRFFSPLVLFTVCLYWCQKGLAILP